MKKGLLPCLIRRRSGLLIFRFEHIPAIKDLGIFGLFILIFSCSGVKKANNDVILVTGEGIPDVAIGDSLLNILNGDTRYLMENEEVQSPYGISFMKLTLKIGNEEIAYLNYDKASLEWAKISSIVCRSPKCTTVNGLSVGDNIKALRKVYPEKDDALKGGKDESTEYFIPEDLKKRNEYFLLSKVVVELTKVENDTVISALIVESS